MDALFTMALIRQKYFVLLWNISGDDIAANHRIVESARVVSGNIQYEYETVTVNSESEAT
jgi:hypothetical protein